MLKKNLTASFNTVYEMCIFLIHKCISWDKKVFISQLPNSASVLYEATSHNELSYTNLNQQGTNKTILNN